MLLNRSVNDENLAQITTSFDNNSEENKTKLTVELDLEREMQSIHTFFLKNLYTLIGWKMALEMEHKDLLKKFRTIFSYNLSQIDDSMLKTNQKIGENTTAVALPLEEMFPEAVNFY